jgi:uncharacterized membrane protein YtjA (UPF0391 family)
MPAGNLLHRALVALVIAVIAAVLFGGIAGTAAGIAKILFYIFIVIFLVVLVMNFIGRAHRAVSRVSRARYSTEIHSHVSQGWQPAHVDNIGPPCAILCTRTSTGPDRFWS